MEDDEEEEGDEQTPIGKITPLTTPGEPGAGRGSSQKEAGSCLFLMGTWSGLPPASEVPACCCCCCFSSPPRRSGALEVLSPLDAPEATWPRPSELSGLRPRALPSGGLRSRAGGNCGCRWWWWWQRGKREYFWEKRLSCFCRYFLWSTERRQGADLSRAALMSLEAKLTKLRRVFTSLSAEAIAQPGRGYEEARKKEGPSMKGLAPSEPSRAWEQPKPRRSGRLG